jgi:hypothetical protein
MLGLANQYHSPEQSAVVGKLQLLFNDKIDVSDAASAIHDLLSPRSTVCIPSYDCKPPSPDPLEANTAFLWDCLGKAAMMVPVNHEGMGRMVCLVHALARMPLVKVKYALHGGDEVREVMASLCNLDEDDPCSLGKVLFCLHECKPADKHRNLYLGGGKRREFRLTDVSIRVICPQRAI